MKRIIEIRDGTFKCTCPLCNHFNNSGNHYLLDVIDENESEKQWRKWTIYYGLFFPTYVIDKGLTKIILLLYLTNVLEQHAYCPLMSFLMNNE